MFGDSKEIQSRAMKGRIDTPRTAVVRLRSVTASTLSHEQFFVVYPEKRSSISLRWECGSCKHCPERQDRPHVMTQHRPYWRRPHQLHCAFCYFYLQGQISKLLQHVCHSEYSIHGFVFLSTLFDCMALIPILSSSIPPTVTSKSSSSAKQSRKPQRTFSPFAHAALIMIHHSTVSSPASWFKVATFP